MRLKKTEKGKTTDVLAAKAVVTASVSDGTRQYTVDGKPAPKAVLRIYEATSSSMPSPAPVITTSTLPGSPKSPVTNGRSTPRSCSSRSGALSGAGPSCPRQKTLSAASGWRAPSVLMGSTP